MLSDSKIDCIVVGYNDVDFNTYMARHKEMEQYSGAYDELKWNSLIFNGKRMLQMDLLSDMIAKSRGIDPRLNVFEIPGAGVLYLKDYLTKRGFNIDIISFFNYEKEKFKELLDQSPRAVAITTTFYVDNDPIIEITNFIREHNPDVQIIIGGPHIYNLAFDHDEETRQYIFDLLGGDIYVYDSQGEQTLSRVLKQLTNGRDLSRVPNLYFKSEDGIFEKTQREIEDNDMDENAIDWSCFDTNLITPMAYIRTARSCPFVCAFCNYPELAGAHVLNSIEVVERQLRQMHEAGTRVVAFIDDTFNFPLDRFKQLLRMMIRNRFNFRWISFLRCTNVDEEVLDLMQESGCLGVLLGIESGDQTILKNMKKAAMLHRYRWALGELHKRNIATLASIICGFPGETEQSVKNTVAFLEETAPTFFTIQLYYHDPRTPIQKRKEEFSISGAGFSWKHQTMDWRKASEWSKYMVRNINNSIPIGIYRFTMWGIGYLVSRGISVEQIKTFGEITRDMLLNSLGDDFSKDCSAQEQQLIELFRSNQVESI